MLNPSPLQPGEMRDYCEELSLSLWSGRQNAALAIQAAQKRYKAQYDSRVKPTNYVTGDWVLVKFPPEESGRMRKLSRPWHGPYRITNTRRPDVDVSKVYRPQDGGIQVHQSRVKHCPPNFRQDFTGMGASKEAREGHQSGLNNYCKRTLANSQLRTLSKNSKEPRIYRILKNQVITLVTRKKNVQVPNASLHRLSPKFVRESKSTINFVRIPATT